jgi:glycosyltransferase involved in cell wall biosynthesis
VKPAPSGSRARGDGEQPLSVGFDASPLLDPPTGVGRYARELASSLEARGVRVKRYAVALRGRDQPSVTRWRVPARLAQGTWRRLGRPRLDRLVGPVDVVHGTNFVLPALASAPGLVTIHDLSYLRDDAWPGAGRLRRLVPWSLARAAGVIVPTTVVADEVAGRYGIDPAAVTVSGEGVSPAFFGATPLADGALADLGIVAPFVVAVGTIAPRKNLQSLLAAWERVRSRLRGWSLVLAGPAGWGPALPPAEGVVLPGWVGDETLPGLLAAAQAFCYPSVYEGFGLPPLEAMAAGTPVLAGRYSAATEVLNNAALLVDATNVEALADGIVTVASDDAARRRLVTAGRARAAMFTWERAARATERAYRRTLEQ